MSDDYAPITRPRQMWIKAFYGFSPEDHGYIGFSEKVTRDRWFEEVSPNDLVLIYGSVSSETGKDDQARAMGFLQIETEKIFNVDRMSDFGQSYFRERGWLEKWPYSLPVSRAWKIEKTQIRIQQIAADTYRDNAPIHFSRRGALMSLADTERALSLRVKEVNVFGRPPVTSSAVVADEPLRFFFPSRGFEPSFGSFEMTRTDGLHYLYLMQANGPVGDLLNRDGGAMDGKKMVKVGISKKLAQREKQLNKAWPPKLGVLWKLAEKSQPQPDGAAAKKIEDAIKLEFAKKFESLGGEFFLGDMAAILKAFRNFPGVANTFR